MLRKLLGLSHFAEEMADVGGVRNEDPQLVIAVGDSHAAVEDTLAGPKFLTDAELGQSLDHKKEVRPNEIGGSMTVYVTNRIPPEFDYGTPHWPKPNEHLVIPRGPFTESSYQEIGGHIRLVKEVWRGPDVDDLRNGNTLDVTYDHRGFPVKCLVSRGTGEIVKEVKNTFDDLGRLLERETITFGDDGVPKNTETRVQSHYTEGPFAGLIRFNTKKGSREESDRVYGALSPLPSIGYELK